MGADRAASAGPSASTSTSTTRAEECTNAKVRPRTSSSTSSPSSVYPVTQATPPHGAQADGEHDRQPRCSASAPAAARNTPENTRAKPNSRRREKPASSRGPIHMPSARPTNTAAEQHAEPGLAGAEVADEGLRQADHEPAAAKAPSMPRTSPRTTGVLPTNRQPVEDRTEHADLRAGRRDPRLGNRQPAPDHQAETRKVMALAYRRQLDRVDVGQAEGIASDAVGDQREHGVDQGRDGAVP